MMARNKWIFFGSFVLLLSIIGALLLFRTALRETHIDGKTLHAHLHELHNSVSQARKLKLGYIRSHTTLFAPYCLKTLLNRPTLIESYVRRFRSKYGKTPLGYRLGIRSPDRNVKTRAMAACALSVLDIADAEKVRALQVGFLEGERQTRMESVKALAAMGSLGLPIFQASLDDPSVDLRNAALYGIYLLGDEAEPALVALRELLMDASLFPDPLLFEVFVRIGPRAVPVLGQALDTPNALVKARLIKAMVPLRRLNAPYRQLFIDGLKDGDPDVRLESARGFVAVGGVDAKSAVALFPLLGDPSPKVRLVVLQLFSQISPFAEPMLVDLITLLEDDDKEIRRLAARIIEGLPLDLEASMQILQVASNAQNAFVREVAQKALVDKP
ncbi:hypothetical protein N8703_00910 [Verrucomicrobia bacterium]|nr:hypothetical protein [Verrucomicrobiota bacterium]